jgi:hypothetical protein
LDLFLKLRHFHVEENCRTKVLKKKGFPLAVLRMGVKNYATAGENPLTWNN